MSLTSEGLSEVYLENYQRLIRFAVVKLRMSPEDAEDAVSTVWTRVVSLNNQDKLSFEGREPIRYLRVALKNAKKDRDSARRGLPLDDPTSLEDPSTDPIGYLEGSEKRLRVRRVLDQIEGTKHQKALEFLLEGLSRAEVGKELRIKRSYCNTLIREAQARFKRKYGRHYE